MRAITCDKGPRYERPGSEIKEFVLPALFDEVDMIFENVRP